MTLNKMPTSRDVAILHESRIFKSLLEKAARINPPQSPNRNPILQEGQDYVQEFRPCFMRLGSAERVPESLDENFKRTKAMGEFNYNYNPPQDPRPQGIKAFSILPSPCLDENPRRISKAVRHKSEIRRNPILDGDQTSGLIKRSRKPGVQTDHQEKLNQRKYFLPADRGRSSRGKVFRDGTFTLGETEISSTVGSTTDRMNTTAKVARPLTATEEKVRGYIKGVLQYEAGPKFRDEIVTDKCNKVKFADILKPQDPVDRIFGRKKTLEY